MNLGSPWPDDGPGRAEIAAFGETLADAARIVACREFRASNEVQYKADGSPVTRADREVEETLTALIRERFPGHAVIGEEFGCTGSADARWRWVLDPIDGTKNFVTGRPLFGTLIAFLEGDRPILGVIEAPALGERYVGMAGEPTRFNGRVCRTSGCARLADARVSATTPDLFDSDELVAFDEVSFAARLRTFGGDSYQYTQLAAGHLDLVVEAKLAPYDLLALPPVVTGAGGIITDWAGEPLTARSDGTILAAATPELHEEVLGRLRNAVPDYA